ncbi:MerR family transcriptional regulator [Rhizobium sp. Root274]|uniref:Cu(I)-responsive transcriptional regulator n=1 Tax=unclassified Rhizobium TaxID=2613769 RepID=UPI000713ACEC|nr:MULTISPECIES: Cu(I)-responsive transcriptional regulator [unclassified Rhizobium]KQW32275.1 MerR family transcriptional regulator [Rhizobium sp. Root1240]KRD33817.1 MerR family transcriptional regulator [Rhizobium sp. Root274]
MNIGEAADASGVSAKMIRYYEEIGLIATAGRTASNYRVYDADSVNRLRFVRRSRKLGFSLEETERLLKLWDDKERASAEVKALALAHVEELETKIAEMQAMRDTLFHLAERCHGDNRPNCPILADLEGRPQRPKTIPKTKGETCCRD